MEIKIDRVSKHYGSKQALRDISFTIGKGVTALLGRNGAGKSTLMRMLATIAEPSTGKIYYNGVNIGQKPNEIRRVLGYLPQEFGLYPNMTPVEFLEYMAAMKSLPRKRAMKRIHDLLEILHLSESKKRQIGGFSGGMRQRVGIAQALLNDPDVLIVDEPTVGLDPEERMQFRNLLSAMSADRIILLSTHIVSDIESIAPSIAIMSSGVLVAHTTPEQLLQQAENNVWECIVSMNQLQELQSRFNVSQAIQRKEGLQVRIVASEQPVLGAQAAQPTLEDAYLYATMAKGVR